MTVTELINGMAVAGFLVVAAICAARVVRHVRRHRRWQNKQFIAGYQAALRYAASRGVKRPKSST